MLRLAAEGRLDLNDRVGRWLRRCPADWQGITLHHLLTHTAGLGHSMIDFAEEAEPDELLSTFHRPQLLFAPGDSWSYNSSGYVPLAHVVVQAGDTPFMPLGLTSTFAGASAAEPDLARGHDAQGRWVPSWALDTVGMGTGDIWSTARGWAVVVSRR